MDRAPSVTPLELWDMLVQGQPLQHYRWEPSFPRMLAAVVEGLRTGALERDVGAQARELGRHIDTVYLTGGDAGAQLVAPLVDLGLTVNLAEDPVFAAVRAGWELAPPPIDLCADLGQTSIKLFDGRRTWRIERDRTRAPILGQDDDRGDARRSTLEFIADALTTDGSPSRLLLALPCEIDEEQAPSACTYCWHDPDPSWRSELADRLGIATRDLRLINDAELAALAASRELGPRPKPALVLTIGFGVGAAILGPS